jgi:hypothetical protein
MAVAVLIVLLEAQQRNCPFGVFEDLAQPLKALFIGRSLHVLPEAFHSAMTARILGV